MEINLPKNWNALPSESDSRLPIKFHKMYPDGTDVILEIRQENKIELWSRAEHRCSGPNENKESEHDELNSAINAALTEMIGWDEYLAKHL